MRLFLRRRKPQNILGPDFDLRRDAGRPCFHGIWRFHRHGRRERNRWMPDCSHSGIAAKCKNQTPITVIRRQHKRMRPGYHRSGSGPVTVHPIAGNPPNVRRNCTISSYPAFRASCAAFSDQESPGAEDAQSQGALTAIRAVAALDNAAWPCSAQTRYVEAKATINAIPAVFGRSWFEADRQSGSEEAQQRMDATLMLGNKRLIQQRFRASKRAHQFCKKTFLEADKNGKTCILIWFQRRKPLCACRPDGLVPRPANWVSFSVWPLSRSTCWKQLVEPHRPEFDHQRHVKIGGGARHGAGDESVEPPHMRRACGPARISPSPYPVPVRPLPRPRRHA